MVDAEWGEILRVGLVVAMQLMNRGENDGRMDAKNRRHVLSVLRVCEI